MAKKTYVLDEWRGLNEAPDGDTGLLLGEASVQRDIRVTRDRNLQQRPGYMTLHDFGAPVRGLWIGSVKGEEVSLMLNKLFRYKDFESHNYPLRIEVFDQVVNVIKNRLGTCGDLFFDFINFGFELREIRGAVLDNRVFLIIFGR